MLIFRIQSSIQRTAVKSYDVTDIDTEEINCVEGDNNTNVGFEGNNTMKENNAEG